MAGAAAFGTSTVSCRSEEADADADADEEDDCSGTRSIKLKSSDCTTSAILDEDDDDDDGVQVDDEEDADSPAVSADSPCGGRGDGRNAYARNILSCCPSECGGPNICGAAGKCAVAVDEIIHKQMLLPITFLWKHRIKHIVHTRHEKWAIANACDCLSSETCLRRQHDEQRRHHLGVQRIRVAIDVNLHARVQKRVHESGGERGLLRGRNDDGGSSGGR